MESWGGCEWNPGMESWFGKPPPHLSIWMAAATPRIHIKLAADVLSSETVTAWQQLIMFRVCCYELIPLKPAFVLKA